MCAHEQHVGEPQLFVYTYIQYIVVYCICKYAQHYQYSRYSGNV